MSLVPFSLGFVTVATPGTPVALSASSQNTPQFRVQPRKNATTENAGNVYLITQSTGGKGTATTIYAVLVPEQIEGFVLPPVQSNIYDISNWYVDADVAGDGVLVSYVL